MQSLNRMGEVKECVKNYGMVIVDECHHVSAFSFEQILKKNQCQKRLWIDCNSHPEGWTPSNNIYAVWSYTVRRRGAEGA